MRVAVLGGTGFIGRAITADLRMNGFDVVVVHRGFEEAPEAEGVPHVHADRASLEASHLQDAEGFVDVRALTRTEARQALDAVPDGVRAVALSSMDVYRAYTTLLANGPATDAVPFDETSPVRDQRYPFRGAPDGRGDEYEKLDVEEEYIARGGTVLRLPMVYGPCDRQRREEFVLRRVRAGRKRMPFGAGTWLWSRGYVDDAAQAVRLALTNDGAGGEIFNVCERRTLTVRQWAERIAETANAEIELVTVSDPDVPEDLETTRAIAQHFVCDAAKARGLLGFRETDPDEALARSVAWHLAHPPASDGDFAADDAALATSR